MTSPADSLLGGGAEPSAYRALLRNRNYRYWFASSVISSLGDWMAFVALPVIVAGLFPAGSQQALFALGGVLMMRLLPSAVFGPVAGVIADRYDRKHLIVFTDVIRFALFVAITFSSDVIALFALTFIVECVSLLFLAAKDSSLPSVVQREHLTEANQLNLLTSYGTMPLGAVSATALIAFASWVGGLVPFDPDPLRLALFLNALSYLPSALLMAQVNLPQEKQRRQRDAEQRPGIIAELREGLEFIRGYPLLRALIGGVVGVFFGAGVVVGLGPEFVRSELGRPEQDWSVLISAVGGGLVFGIVVLVPLLRRFSQLRVFPIFLAVTGGLAALIAVMPTFMLALVFGVALGAAAGVSVVKGYTLLHEHTEDATRARTFAAFYTLTRMVLFLSLAAGPFLAGAVGSVRLGTNVYSGTISGIRLTLLLGGLVAMWSGLRARKAIADARDDAERPVRMTAPDPGPLQGLFVAFEGVEGAGKSTQIRLLAEQLEAEGHDVVVTREPGGSPLAERVRELLLDPNAADMDDRTEALLYAAARAEHVSKVIRPALEAGQVVLCDRFVDSSLAYQGHARGLGSEDVFEVNRWAVDGVLADVVVLLQLDPAEGLRRVGERARRKRAERTRDAARSGLYEIPRLAQQLSEDRLEREGLDFHQRVARGYLELARRDRRRFLVVDATADAHTIAKQIRAGLHAWLPLPQAESGRPAGAQDRPPRRLPDESSG